MSETTKPVIVSTVIGQNAEVRFEGTAGERVFVELTDSTTGTTTLELESPSDESLAFHVCL